MKFDIITIFPKSLEPIISESILGRAQKKGIVSIKVHNLRDYTLDKHKKVDDRPFGGGPGMVFCAEPIFRAVSTLRKKNTRVILLSASGRLFNQKEAMRLSKYRHLILICGHYEGVDERVKAIIDEEISIGDYVLTGGEIPSLVIVDAVARLIKGVVGRNESLTFESFCANLLEYPQYTRPANFRGLKVPKILLSGDHKQIEQWRKIQSLKKTKQIRPDLLNGGKKCKKLEKLRKI
ncbi:MAG: tRNA (guanosine(37)-N1)-methyltransferase TrmD [Candidatus Omnitrophota bacterium]